MLPVISVPTAEMTLPVSGEKIRVKAFTLRDDKIFAYLKDVGTKNDIIFTVTNLLKTSILEGNTDPNDYSVTDIIAIFLKICEISKGYLMDMKYICNNVIDGNKCGAIIETRIDIKDYEITGKQIKKPIKLTGDISVKMHYPTMRNFTESNDFGTSDEERHLWLVVKCIDKIYKGTELFEEFTQEELYEWVQELPLESAEEIGKFFETYPLIKKKITLVCPTCGRETSWELGALEDFFDSGILTRII